VQQTADGFPSGKPICLRSGLRDAGSVGGNRATRLPEMALYLRFWLKLRKPLDYEGALHALYGLSSADPVATGN
jgi:hypothetical protein